MPGKKYHNLTLGPGDLVSKHYIPINLVRYFIIVEEVDHELYTCFCLDDGNYDYIDLTRARTHIDISVIEKLA